MTAGWWVRRRRKEKAAVTLSDHDSNVFESGESKGDGKAAQPVHAKLPRRACADGIRARPASQMILLHRIPLGDSSRQGRDSLILRLRTEVLRSG